jgi:hypothetical protein
MANTEPRYCCTSMPPTGDPGARSSLTTAPRRAPPRALPARILARIRPCRSGTRRLLTMFGLFVVTGVACWLASVAPAPVGLRTGRATLAPPRPRARPARPPRRFSLPAGLPGILETETFLTPAQRVGSSRSLFLGLAGQAAEWIAAARLEGVLAAAAALLGVLLSASILGPTPVTL